MNHLIVHFFFFLANNILHVGVLCISFSLKRCIEIYKTGQIWHGFAKGGLNYPNPPPELLRSSVSHYQAALQKNKKSPPKTNTRSGRDHRGRHAGLRSAVPALFPSGSSCREQPGCNRIGSWWSPVVIGWSWPRRWPCTSCRSCCTGWDSRCSPAASAARCTRHRTTRRERWWTSRVLYVHLHLLQASVYSHYTQP